MCRTKMATRASQPSRSPNPNPRPSTPKPSSDKPSSSNTPQSPLGNPFRSRSSSSSSSSTAAASTSTSAYILGSSVATTSASSRTSLTSLRNSLPQNPQIYDFADIRSATNNFLAKRFSSSSSSSQSWRCVLHGQDVVIFQRKLRKSITTTDVKDKLAVISRSHFTSIVKLLGVSISNQHIYLVYEFVNGSDLSLCLRNKINPDFTILSSWISRMQIATDIAHGLEYIHNNAGLSIDMVHKHIKSSSIIVVSDPSHNAKICHFGAAELCGETVPDSSNQLNGASGYMAPEFRSSGVPTQKSDVYAFGVVILELITGEEPLKYRFDRSSGGRRLVSLIETAREAVDDGGGASAAAVVEGKIRRWVDIRVKDSFPVEAAEKLARVALQCVEEDPERRPDMKWVAGKISKLYLESRVWADRVRVPTEISVSIAPR